MTSVIYQGKTYTMHTPDNLTIGQTFKGIIDGSSVKLQVTGVERKESGVVYQTKEVITG